MVRVLLFVILSVFLARAFWRMIDGIIEGYSGPASRSNAVSRGVPMARDPVCGTYVVPDRAMAVNDRGRQVFFCSAVCRSKYQAKT